MCAFRAPIRIGYPTRKLYYYRDAMQKWRLLGFNVIVSRADKTAAR